MAGKGDPKRHHYVPRMYLRNFADHREMITVVDRKDDKVYKTNIINAAVESDFYSMVGQDGEWSADFEHAMAEFEGHVAPAIRRIVDDDIFPPSEEDRGVLALFIASQWIRTPRVRDQMAQMADLMFKIQVAVGGRDEVRSALEAAGFDASDEAVEQEWAELTDFDSYEVRPHQNDHLSYLGKSVEETASLLANASFCLVRFSRKKLLTSDTVVSLYRAPHPDNELWGIGLLTADEVHVPLSRDVALILLPRGDVHGMRFPASTNMAKHINQVVAANSRRWLYRHPDDTPLEGIELPPWSERRIQASQKPEDFLPKEDRV